MKQKKQPIWEKARKQKEKKVNNGTSFVGFLKYEWDRISDGGKALYSKVFRFGRKVSSANEERSTKKVKEQGTFKTAKGVFKEAWHTGKDLKKMLLFKIAESVIRGVGPYCKGLLYGSLSGLVSGSPRAVYKFYGIAGLEALRDRLGSICSFNGRIAERVLNVTHANATVGRLYEEILHKPRPYFKLNAPETLNGVVGDIVSAKNTLLNTSVDCLSKAVIFGISSASLFSINPGLAIGVLGAAVVASEFGGYSNSVFRKFRSKILSLENWVRKENNDSIKNTPLVQEANRIDFETYMMHRRLDKSSKAIQKVKYAEGKGALITEIIVSTLVDAGIIWVSTMDVLETRDIGRFALISMASWQMLWSGNALSEIWSKMRAETHKLIDASKKKITPKELERVMGLEKLSENDTKISVQNVSFSYPVVKDVTNMSLVEVMDRGGEIRRTENVIKNMSVEFDKGGLTAVVGTSGNGKSTLMSLIRHDYDPEEGQIFIGDKEIRTLSDEELNAQIAFVDQKLNFFDNNISYNLKYFKTDATEDELMEACKKAGFEADVAKFEDGLFRRIGQDGSTTSGGQKQRIALARTFLSDKPIVIMDEPTTGLDQKLSFIVVKTLKEMAQDRTVIMVTHNPTEVALADRVVVVENGTISADGKPMDLIRTSDFLQNMLTEEDIKNKRKLYNISINGENPMQTVARIVNTEAEGKVLSDTERMKKRKLLEAHKRAFVGVRKNALKSARVKEGKRLPEKNNMLNVSWNQSKEM